MRRSHAAMEVRLGTINEVVDLARDGDVAVITMNGPPANALDRHLCAGLKAALAEVVGKVVVLHGSQTVFSTGVDVTQVGFELAAPRLREVIAAIADCAVPVVAWITGQALAGGLELALGCDYRVASPGAEMGLPEVTVGLLPSAGGTQRLPRIIDPLAAMAMIVSGKPVRVGQAHGLIDAICSTREEAVAFAAAQIGKPRAVVRDHAGWRASGYLDLGAFDEAGVKLLSRARGQRAPASCLAAVRAAMTLPIEEGMEVERTMFGELVHSDESRALRYAMSAERKAQRQPGLPAMPKLAPVTNAAIIGAGTMGGGIAMCFASVGIPVTVVETGPERLSRGMDVVEKNYRTAVTRGSMAAGEVAVRMARIRATTDVTAIADADVVIEAVFETMEVKASVFANIDAHAKAGTLLASNTSTLDIDRIARFTRRPADVLGMHFFSPANVMKLLEIVRGRHSSPEAVARAQAIGRTIGKISAVVGVCDGFVGNRMLDRRLIETERLLLEGARPRQIDAVVTRFGFAMGPCAMEDLVGLDSGCRVRRERGSIAPISDALCEAGRYGQKTGAGYYRYEGRESRVDPEVDHVIADQQRKAGVVPRSVADDEIAERMVFPMINEGARILDEGIATCASDIDVIWINGYGWPRWTGGPMFHADHVGLTHVADRLEALADLTGDDAMRPAPLLRSLARSGRTFAAWPGASAA